MVYSISIDHRLYGRNTQFYDRLFDVFNQSDSSVCNTSLLSCTKRFQLTTSNVDQRYDILNGTRDPVATHRQRQCVRLSCVTVWHIIPNRRTIHCVACVHAAAASLQLLERFTICARAASTFGACSGYSGTASIVAKERTGKITKRNQATGRQGRAKCIDRV